MPLSEELLKQAKEYKDSVDKTTPTPAKSNVEKSKKSSKKHAINKHNYNYDIENLKNSPYASQNVNNTINQVNSSVSYDGKRKYEYKPRIIEPIYEEKELNNSDINIVNQNTTKADTVPTKEDTINQVLNSIVNQDNTLIQDSTTPPPVEEISESKHYSVPHRNIAYDLDSIINSPYAFENLSDNSQAYVNVPQEDRKPRRSISKSSRQNISSNNEENQRGNTLEGIKAFLFKPEDMTSEEHKNFKSSFISAAKDKIDETIENSKQYLNDKYSHLADNIYRTVNPSGYLADRYKKSLSEIAPTLNSKNNLENQDDEYWGNEAKSQELIDYIESLYQEPIDIGGGKIRGILTPNHAERFFTNKQDDTIDALDLNGQWITTPFVPLNKDTKPTDIPDNHFLPNSTHHASGYRPEDARYMSFTNDGRYLITDTIPNSENGYIGTSWGAKGKSAKIDNNSIVITDKNGNYGGYLYPRANRNLGSNYIKVKLPNNKEYWLYTYGQDSKEYVKLINELGSRFDELNFTNYDSNSAGASYRHKKDRYDPKYYGNRRFDNIRVITKRKGGRRSLK